MGVVSCPCSLCDLLVSLPTTEVTMAPLRPSANFKELQRQKSMFLFHHSIIPDSPPNFCGRIHCTENGYLAINDKDMENTGLKYVLQT